jgi:hypothetical protein
MPQASCHAALGRQVSRDFLLYELLLGVGISLISGTDVALLYDSEVYLQLEKLGATGAGASKSLSRLISVEAARIRVWPAWVRACCCSSAACSC